MRPITVVALLALFIASPAGCGGGVGGTDAGWIEEADAICRANESATASLSRRLESVVRTGLRTPNQRAAAAAIMQRGLPHLASEIAALRRLRPPSENGPSLFPLINRLMQKHAVGERLSHAFATGAGPEIVALVRILEGNEKLTRRIARAAGLRVCGVNA